MTMEWTQEVVIELSQISAFDADFGNELLSYAASLSRYSRRLSGDAADADDLLQDTLLRCWIARHSFQPGSNFGAWARTVMRNSFISDRRRDRFRGDLSPLDFDRHLIMAASQPFAVHLRDVGEAFDRLTLEHRNVLSLAIQGYSVEEASQQLSIPKGTFVSRLTRARRRLRQLLEAQSLPLVKAPRAPDRIQRRRRRNWKGVMIG